MRATNPYFNGSTDMALSRSFWVASARHSAKNVPRAGLLTLVMYAVVIVGSEEDLTELSTNNQLFSAVP